MGLPPFYRQVTDTSDFNQLCAYVFVVGVFYFSLYYLIYRISHRQNLSSRPRFVANRRFPRLLLSTKGNHPIEWNFLFSQPSLLYSALISCYTRKNPVFLSRPTRTLSLFTVKRRLFITLFSFRKPHRRIELQRVESLWQLFGANFVSFIKLDIFVSLFMKLIPKYEFPDVVVYYLNFHLMASLENWLLYLVDVEVCPRQDWIDNVVYQMTVTVDFM